MLNANKHHMLFDLQEQSDTLLSLPHLVSFSCNWLNGQ